VLGLGGGSFAPGTLLGAVRLRGAAAVGRGGPMLRATLAGDGPAFVVVGSVFGAVFGPAALGAGSGLAAGLDGVNVVVVGGSGLRTRAMTADVALLNGGPARRTTRSAVPRPRRRPVVTPR